MAACGTTACLSPYSFYNPYMIDKRDLHARMDTIALAPFAVPTRVGDRDRVGATIERLATEILTEGGWKIVPMRTMESIWERIAEDVGPVWDARTGEVDDERWDTVQDLVLRELASEHGVDAVLYLQIVPIDVHLTTSDAAFCAASDDRHWADGSLGFGTPATLVRASCLYANLHDLEMRDVYNIRAGLEVFETYAWQTRYVRPMEERFTDEERLAKAVRLLLEPLADRP